MNRVKTVLLLMVITLWLAGCSGDSKKDQPDITGDGAAIGEGFGSGQEDGALTSGYSGDSVSASQKERPWEDPNSPLHQRIIYFALDQTDIASEYRPVITSHAEYLAAHPMISIRLEGHTDERGTREYNIALAEQRARSVAKMMRFQGTSDDQITVISYGEEMPAIVGHSEEAWRRNRRVVIEYLENQQ